MIYLSSHDKFVQISLINLISQINPNLVSSIKNLSFVHIEVQQVNEQLHFTYNQQKAVIKTPIKINNMFDSNHKGVGIRNSSKTYSGT